MARAALQLAEFFHLSSFLAIQSLEDHDVLLSVHGMQHLVPLQKQAKRTETSYVLNAANERVLRALIFKGDSAQHVF